MIKIEKIKVERMPDYDCDLSWIGEFSNTIPDKKYGVKHDGGSRSYPYFVSCNAENKKDAQQDYERMMGYERGNWGMIGIKATAEVHTSENGREWLINHISSAGLWGIEDDSGEEYLKEIESEQLAELRETLRDYGLNRSIEELVELIETI